MPRGGDPKSPLLPPSVGNYNFVTLIGFPIRVTIMDLSPMGRENLTKITCGGWLLHHDGKGGILCA